jgi:hypothetical protein
LSRIIALAKCTKKSLNSPGIFVFLPIVILCRPAIIDNVRRTKESARATASAKKIPKTP